MDRHDPNVLMHRKKFKYIKREFKNGRWVYDYPDNINSVKNQRLIKSNKQTIEAYAKYGNKHSRNMPGSSASEANTGKGMTRLQRAQAMAKGTGNTKEWDKITEQHARYLRKNETGHEHNLKGSSKNTKPYQEFREKFGEDRWTLMTPKKTTKKQIRKGIRRAKVKTLKREAKKAINRAKSWIGGLFD